MASDQVGGLEQASAFDTNNVVCLTTLSMLMAKEKAKFPGVGSKGANGKPKIGSWVFNLTAGRKVV